jgi:hypothetical protein
MHSNKQDKSRYKYHFNVFCKWQKQVMINEILNFIGLNR